MPKFLAVYGTLNKIGAMHSNKETAKGREMERKHKRHLLKGAIKKRLASYAGA